MKKKFQPKYALSIADNSILYQSPLSQFAEEAKQAVMAKYSHQRLEKMNSKGQELACVEEAYRLLKESGANFEAPEEFKQQITTLLQQVSVSMQPKQKRH